MKRRGGRRTAKVRLEKGTIEERPDGAPHFPPAKTPPAPPTLSLGIIETETETRKENVCVMAGRETEIGIETGTGTEIESVTETAIENETGTGNETLRGRMIMRKIEKGIETETVNVIETETATGRGIETGNAIDTRRGTTGVNRGAGSLSGRRQATTPTTPACPAPPPPATPLAPFPDDHAPTPWPPMPRTPHTPGPPPGPGVSLVERLKDAKGRGVLRSLHEAGSLMQGSSSVH